MATTFSHIAWLLLIHFFSDEWLNRTLDMVCRITDLIKKNLLSCSNIKQLSQNNLSKCLIIIYSLGTLLEVLLFQTKTGSLDSFELTIG